MDDNPKIAILNVSKHKFYTLPGGGIDFGESKIEVLHRETKEETGCTIEVVLELGEVLETRYKPHRTEGIIQLNYPYLATLKKILSEPEYTEKEKDNGYKLEWMTIEKAIQLVWKGNIDDYSNRLTILRDVYILEQAREHLDMEYRKGL